MRLCESRVQSCPALGEATRHRRGHLSRIKVLPNARVSSRRLPKQQIRDYRKVDWRRGLGRKADMGRKAKSMQDDPLQPHLKMHAPGLFVRDASTRRVSYGIRP